MLVTEQCNLRCDYCYIYKNAKKMSEETAKRSVDFLIENSTTTDGRLFICFFGGEPLLEPELVALTADYALEEAAKRSLDMRFSMTTNATLIDDKRLNLLKKYNISPTFSLDGIGEAHDRHRKTIAGRGSFKYIERNLLRLLELPFSTIRLTVAPETTRALPDSIRWLIDKGFKRISISPVVEAEWDAAALSDYYDAWLEIYDIQAKLLRADPKDFRVSNIFSMHMDLKSPESREFGCGAARNMVAIDSSGNLYPCHRYVGYLKNDPSAQIGNVFDGYDDKQRDLYISANRIETHRGCGEGLFSDATEKDQRKCSNCSLIGNCGSSCMAVNQHMTGNPTRPHPINRVLSQIHTSVHIQTQYEIPDEYLEPGDAALCATP